MRYTNVFIFIFFIIQQVKGGNQKKMALKVSDLQTSKEHGFDDGKVYVARDEHGKGYLVDPDKPKAAKKPEKKKEE